MAMDDADLRDIRATLAGDGRAYGNLVRRHQAGVTRQMWRFTRDRTELEELVEEVFVQAYTSLDRYRGEAPLEHWLARIATHTGYRFWRQRKRRNERTVPIENWDAPVTDEGLEALSAEEAAQRLHALLAELPPRDRLVLTLMYLEELSVEGIADRTGWSKTMVKVQAHRARKKLAVLLEKAGLKSL